jgi:hypothetical protein
MNRDRRYCFRPWPIFWISGGELAHPGKTVAPPKLESKDLSDRHPAAGTCDYGVHRHLVGLATSAWWSRRR